MRHANGLSRWGSLGSAAALIIILMTTLSLPLNTYVGAAQEPHPSHEHGHAAGESSNPMRHCRSSSEMCCAHAVSCCVVLQAFPLNAPGAHACGLGQFGPDNRSPNLLVPKLPPRLG
jgi:hypothetical protein